MNETTISGIKVADMVIGGMNIITCLLIIIIYIPCLKVIGTDSELSKKSCFKLMFHLGIADMISAILHLILSALVATGYSYDIPFWFNKCVGAIHDGSWYSSTAFLHAIACNRWSVMTSRPMALFTSSGTKYLISLIWIYSGLWMTILLTPMTTFLYYPSIWSSYFDADAPWYKYIKNAGWVNNQLMLWPTAFWYCLTLMHLKNQRNRVAGDELAETRAQGHERALFRQAAIIFLYVMLGSQYWHMAPILMGLGFKYAFALGNWFWLTNSAINPIVYLTMNNTIKNKVGRMIGLVKPKSNVGRPAYVKYTRKPSPTSPRRIAQGRVEQIGFHRV